MKFPVLNFDKSEIVLHVTRARAAEMIRLREAVPVGGRAFRLLARGELMAGRTRVARGGPGAAAGMSQLYTRSGRGGVVNGFKTIYPEDRCFFVPGNNE